MSNAIQASMDGLAGDLSTVRAQLASVESPLALNIAAGEFNRGDGDLFLMLRT